MLFDTVASPYQPSRQKLNHGFLAFYSPEPTYWSGIHPTLGPVNAVSIPHHTYHVLQNEHSGEAWNIISSFVVTDENVKWGECSWEYLSELYEKETQRRYYKKPFNTSFKFQDIITNFGHKPTIVSGERSSLCQIHVKDEEWSMEVPYENVSLDHQKKIMIVSGLIEVD
jgi:hypothetical protein